MGRWLFVSGKPGIFGGGEEEDKEILLDGQDLHYRIQKPVLADLASPADHTGLYP